MTTADRNGHVCPACDYQHNLDGYNVTDLETGAQIPPSRCEPMAGDATVCRGCGVFLTFVDRTTVRIGTADDLAKLSYAARAQLSRVAWAVLELIREQNRRAHAN